MVCTHVPTVKPEDSCKDQIIHNIHIPSLAATLIKLNINISVEDLMKAVDSEEDETRHAQAKSNEEAERALLSKRASTVAFFLAQ